MKVYTIKSLVLPLSLLLIMLSAFGCIEERPRHEIGVVIDLTGSRQMNNGDLVSTISKKLSSLLEIAEKGPVRMRIYNVGIADFNEPILSREFNLDTIPSSRYLVGKGAILASAEVEIGKAIQSSLPDSSIKEGNVSCIEKGVDQILRNFKGCDETRKLMVVVSDFFEECKYCDFMKGEFVSRSSKSLEDAVKNFENLKKLRGLKETRVWLLPLDLIPSYENKVRQPELLEFWKKYLDASGLNRENYFEGKEQPDQLLEFPN